jgi:hypothetical protein
VSRQSFVRPHSWRSDIKKFLAAGVVVIIADETDDRQRTLRALLLGRLVHIIAFLDDRTVPLWGLVVVVFDCGLPVVRSVIKFCITAKRARHYFINLLVGHRHALIIVLLLVRREMDHKDDNDDDLVVDRLLVGNSFQSPDEDEDDVEERRRKRRKRLDAVFIAAKANEVDSRMKK